MTNDLDIYMDESPLYPMAQVGNNLHSTSLPWGETSRPTDTIEASTSRSHESNESNFRDR